MHGREAVVKLERYYVFGAAEFERVKTVSSQSEILAPVGLWEVVKPFLQCRVEKDNTSRVCLESESSEVNPQHTIESRAAGGVGCLTYMTNQHLLAMPSSARRRPRIRALCCAATTPCSACASKRPSRDLQVGTWASLRVTSLRGTSWK